MMLLVAKFGGRALAVNWWIQAQAKIVGVIRRWFYHHVPCTTMHTLNVCTDDKTLSERFVARPIYLFGLGQ